MTVFVKISLDNQYFQFSSNNSLKLLSITSAKMANHGGSSTLFVENGLIYVEHNFPEFPLIVLKIVLKANL